MLLGLTMSDFIIADLLYKHGLLNEKLVIVDCGAAGGSFAEWKSLFSKIIIHGFDPDQKECERLNADARSKGLEHQYYPYLIAGDSENRNFYLTNRSDSSSLFEPDNHLISRYKQKVGDYSWISSIETVGLKKTIKDSTTSLINWANKYSVSNIDFIKLDVQGAELEILKNAGNLLDDVIGMNIEIWFVPVYKKQPLFADVDLFVRNKQFDFFSFFIYTAGQYAGRMASPVSFGKINTSYAQRFAGQLLTADALYLKDPLHLNGVMSLSKKLKLICFAEMNCQVEYAFELLHSLILNSEGQSEMREEISHIIDEATSKYPRHVTGNYIRNSLRVYKNKIKTILYEKIKKPIVSKMRQE